ncbi:hypothetical protein J6V86_01765 [bacterium]|nr:hypothetical protein [bacterium]
MFWANDEHTVEEEMKTCFPDIKLAMERLEEIEKLLLDSNSDHHALIEEQTRLQDWLRKENGYQKR